MSYSPAEPSKNVVEVTKNGIIEILMRGAQTKALYSELHSKLLDRAMELRTDGKKVLVLIDIRSLNSSDEPSDARIEGRRMLSQMSVDGMAIVGSGIVATTVMYTMRIAHVGRNTRFFTNKQQAQAWLEQMRHPKSRTLKVGPVAGITLLAIGLLALIGWQLNNAYLVRWLPSLRPINPLSAVGIMIVGVGFLVYWGKQFRAMRWGGVVTVALGMAALLPLHIDYLLYGGRMTATGDHVQIASSAAICFIAMGIVALVAGRKGRQIEVLEYGLAVLMGCLALFNIFGQLYARDFVYEHFGDFIMAWNLAVAFLICSVALFLLVVYRQSRRNVLRQVSLAGWLVAVILLLVQGATYGIWQQTVNRNVGETSQALGTQTHVIQTLTASKLQAYINALHGFSGLFAASDLVSKSDFTTYYNSLDLQRNYPGLGSVIFISAVRDRDMAAYTTRMRQQGLQTNGGPFTIQSRTKADEHFVLTYTATGTDKNIGLDLTSLAGRQEVYSQALVSKDVYGSGTVTVGAGTPTAYQGFFLTIPVYSATSTKPIGVVNAILNYKLFFSSLFSGSELSPKVGVSLTDQSTGQVIYNANNNSGSGQDAQTDKVSLPVANQRWWLTSRADRTFGVGDVQMRVPALTLVVGQLFSVFLLMLFFILWRGRQRALDLAETITGDLQAERNKAVGNAQRSKAILASIGDGVFAVDMNRRLTLLNPAASEISGVSEEDALGKPYDEVLRFELEKDGSVNDSFIRQAFEGHLATMKNHTILVRADGRRVAVADSAAPIRGAHDKIIGVIVVFRDVSKEYQLDKAKTEFVSLASHQLRTPLSAINWYGEMLLNGDAGKLNKIQHEYVNEIFEGSQRMVELVNGLLDVSRLEVGKLANLPSPTNIAVLIDSLEKELEITVQSKKLHFIKEVSAIPDVIADPKQLRMILQNLMSNAVKYTPDEGSVTITLGPSNTKIARAGGLPDRFAHGHWFLSVSDTGYGIPKDQQAKIFTKMFRADNVRKLDVEGTGLGLYIVREVAEGMGGRVWFESTESIGTTFTVVLPFMTGHHK